MCPLFLFLHLPLFPVFLSQSQHVRKEELRLSQGNKWPYPVVSFVWLCGQNRYRTKGKKTSSNCSQGQQERKKERNGKRLSTFQSSLFSSKSIGFFFRPLRFTQGCQVTSSYLTHIGKKLLSWSPLGVFWCWKREKSITHLSLGLTLFPLIFSPDTPCSAVCKSCSESKRIKCLPIIDRFLSFFLSSFVVFCSNDEEMEGRRSRRNELSSVFFAFLLQFFRPGRLEVFQSQFSRMRLQKNRHRNKKFLFFFSTGKIVFYLPVSVIYAKSRRMMWCLCVVFCMPWWWIILCVSVCVWFFFFIISFSFFLSFCSRPSRP